MRKVLLCRPDSAFRIAYLQRASGAAYALQKPDLTHVVASSGKGPTVPVLQRRLHSQRITPSRDTCHPYNQRVQFDIYNIEAAQECVNTPVLNSALRKLICKY